MLIQRRFYGIILYVVPVVVIGVACAHLGTVPGVRTWIRLESFFKFKFFCIFRYSVCILVIRNLKPLQSVLCAMTAPLVRLRYDL